MCNRYRTARDIEKLRTIFANAPAEWFERRDRYDSVYPRSPVPVVFNAGGGAAWEYEHFQWGIYPAWGKRSADLQTNSKSETVLEKPTFRNSFLLRRCLMPADAFFEPLKIAGAKTRAIRFELKDGAPFAFAGIWNFSHGEGKVKSCSMLTTEPNELVAEVHTRMPVILRPQQFELYLNTPPAAAGGLLDICVPYPADEMTGSFDEEST